MNEHLYRSRDDRMLAGVAGGLAEIWDADPSLIRIVWAMLVVLTGGLALLVYIIMAIVVPEQDASTPAGSPERREARRAARAARRAAGTEHGNSAGIVIGALLILIGLAFSVRTWLPALDFDYFWPLALVGLGVVVLVVGWRRDSQDGGSAT
jgi:phage shock protein C